MAATPNPTVADGAGRAGTRGSARDRLLAAANDLFYAEGVQSVGIDRVIERAGVAKASLYNTFGSKDELVRAYLKGRHAITAKRIGDAIGRYDTPREQLLAIFDAAAALASTPGYRGCAFAAASAEAAPDSSVPVAVDAYRGWLRGVFRDLAERAGAAAPDVLAQQLHLLYDGAAAAGRLDRSPEGARAARATAELLIDLAVA